MILDKGDPISYSTAAQALGCTTKQVAKRMARYRQKGINVMELAELIRISKQYRPDP